MSRALVSSSIEAWTRAVVRHRRLVLAAWLCATVAGALAAFSLPSLLVNSLEVPGSASQHAETILARDFGDSGEGTFVVAFRERDHSAAAVAVLQRRLDAAARSLPHAHATELQAGSGIEYGDVATGLGLQSAERLTPVLRHALAGPGAPTLVTGEPALQHDLNPILAADLHRGDAIALLAAFVVLLIAFGWSLAVAVPFLFAAATITSALGVLYLLAHAFTISSYAPNLADLIGLGLAIDYSLLIVHRFRQELAVGDDVNEALVRTMRTAGRATLISGAAVALGLMVVLLTPVPFVRSLGLAGVLVPLTSVLAVVTLQPALLSLLGRHVARSRRADRSVATTPVGGRWSSFAAMLTRRPRLFVTLSVVLLLACALPATGLTLTPGSITAIPQSTQSARGLRLLDLDAGPGEITPVEIVIDTGTIHGAAGPGLRAGVRRLVNIVSDDPEAYVTAYGWRAPYVSPEGRFVRVFVVGRHEFGAGPMQALVRRLRTSEIPRAKLPSRTHAYVGGATAQGVDYLSSVYGRSLWCVAAVLAVAFLVLLRAFASIPLAASAVLLNVLSTLATLGLLVLIFPDGLGHQLLGLYAEPSVEGWIPIFLIAMLFGLSMDYEVFLVLRIREARDHGADTAQAVRDGLTRTGPVITAAAAIMIVAFGGFLVGRVAGLQEFGAGLAVAVALDATVVRLVLVPSLALSLGARAWWLPGRLAHVAEPAEGPVAPAGARSAPDAGNRGEAS